MREESPRRGGWETREGGGGRYGERKGRTNGKGEEVEEEKSEGCELCLWSQNDAGCVCTYIYILLLGIIVPESGLSTLLSSQRPFIRFLCCKRCRRGWSAGEKESARRRRTGKRCKPKLSFRLARLTRGKPPYREESPGRQDRVISINSECRKLAGAASNKSKSRFPFFWMPSPNLAVRNRKEREPQTRLEHVFPVSKNKVFGRRACVGYVLGL